MPRYHFNIRGRGLDVADHEGEDLLGIEEAHHIALGLVHHLAGSFGIGEPRLWSDTWLEVTDDDDRVVLRIPLATFGQAMPGPEASVPSVR